MPAMTPATAQIGFHALRNICIADHLFRPGSAPAQRRLPILILSSHGSAMLTEPDRAARSSSPVRHFSDSQSAQ